jgi:antitoxin VapB
MTLSIKNRELESSARELARLKGTTITKALLDCAQKEIRLQKELHSVLPKADLWSRIQQIQREYAALPTRESHLSDDEVLGYDEFGIPSK